MSRSKVEELTQRLKQDRPILDEMGFRTFMSSYGHLYAEMTANKDDSDELKIIVEAMIVASDYIKYSLTVREGSEHLVFRGHYKSLGEVIRSMEEW